MPQLSEQAQKLINDFKQRIKSLPPEERVEVLRKMTESLTALNQEVKHTFNIFQGMHKKEPEVDHNKDNLRDFI